eukprot:gnl/TRDRNA2_/TRDRNA2_177930_c0_seq12.p1 gnl/TRDRNA2_/TRDRNA2_177930_c0~~gnl/TRDRNA2_/TRDRNA2_177930_c0_seq12.p1  ORF type:complete len:285 (-),score=-27.09 gnl/TRDRNA2_/TRDRNA2_177930_c0_seq12:111-965(-)
MTKKSIGYYSFTIKKFQKNIKPIDSQTNEEIFKLHRELLVHKIEKIFRFTQIRSKNNTKNILKRKRKKYHHSIPISRNNKCSKKKIIPTFVNCLSRKIWNLKHNVWRKKTVANSLGIINRYNPRRRLSPTLIKKVNLAHKSPIRIILTEEFVITPRILFTTSLPRNYRPLLSRKIKHKMLIQNQIMVVLRSVYIYLNKKQKTLIYELNTSARAIHYMVNFIYQLIDVCEIAKLAYIKAITQVGERAYIILLYLLWDLNSRAIDTSLFSISIHKWYNLSNNSKEK